MYPFAGIFLTHYIDEGKVKTDIDGNIYNFVDVLFILWVLSDWIGQNNHLEFPTMQCCHETWERSQ